MSDGDCIDRGVVKSVKGDCAVVSLLRTPECDGCKACIFGKKSEIAVPARNPVGAKAGDAVRVDLHRSEGASVALVLVGFGIPLVLLLASIVVCAALGVRDWIALLVSLGAAFVGFVVTVPVDRALRRSRFGTEIVEILPPAAPTPAPDRSDDPSEKES